MRRGALCTRCQSTDARAREGRCQLQGNVIRIFGTCHGYGCKLMLLQRYNSNAVTRERLHGGLDDSSARGAASIDRPGHGFCWRCCRRRVGGGRWPRSGRRGCSRRSITELSMYFISQQEQRASSPRTTIDAAAPPPSRTRAAGRRATIDAAASPPSRTRGAGRRTTASEASS